MKKEKSSVQNNTLAILNGREIVYDPFDSGIFSLSSKKTRRIRRRKKDSIPPEFYGRRLQLISKSPADILSEPFWSRGSTNGCGT